MRPGARPSERSDCVRARSFSLFRRPSRSRSSDSRSGSSALRAERRREPILASDTRRQVYESQALLLELLEQVAAVFHMILWPKHGVDVGRGDRGGDIIAD